jgi:NADPH2:quinone reductase
VSIGWRAGSDEAGNRGGPLQLSLAQLTERSIGCAGFWMRHVVEDRQVLCGIAEELFDLAKRAQLVAWIDRIVALTEVGQAHAAMAARSTVGKVLVDVNRDR